MVALSSPPAPADSQQVTCLPPYTVELHLTHRKCTEDNFNISKKLSTNCDFAVNEWLVATSSTSLGASKDLHVCALCPTKMGMNEAIRGKNEGGTQRLARKERGTGGCGKDGKVKVKVKKKGQRKEMKEKRETRMGL